METTTKNKAWLRLLLIISVPIIVFSLAEFFIILQVANNGMSAGMACLILILLMVVTGIVAFFFLAAILRNLGCLLKNFDKVADGTMTFEDNKLMKRSDELGQMMRKVGEMMKSLAQVVMGIRNAVDSLDSLSDGFRKSFDNMSAAVEQVACEVERITANTVSQTGQTKEIEDEIFNISHAIETIAENILALTESANKMKEYNTSSEEIIQELVAISADNSSSIENVRSQTNLTNHSAQEIRQATELIAGIASQTNLLALNASIEAARAGEHGKGFAVVAEEIRILADQSRESSAQISQIVDVLIQNSNESVEVTQKVSDAFVKQNEKIRTTGNLFEKLYQEITNVSSSIDGINSEVNTLNRHKDVMKDEITVLADAAESNTASAKETADAMLEFEGLVSNCKQATEQITSVTKDLVGDIEKLNLTAERRKALLADAAD